MLFEELLGSTSLLRGEVCSKEECGHIVRVHQGAESWFVTAETLITSDVPLTLSPNDRVLCLVEAENHEHGVILGRLGGVTPRPETHERIRRAAIETDDQPQDSLTIEAKHSLTLRVGDGSITIREDGKILIKGKDLVSHAQRMNRIKGGAVSIN